MVAIPHTFAGRQGTIAASELDDDFQALADAIDENPSVVNVSPSNTAAVNRGIIQAAHDALPAAGGILQFTRYGIHIDGPINISKPVRVLGPGTTEVSTPGPFVLYLDTGSQVGWEVTAKGPFLMQDFSMFGAALTKHVHVNGPTGSLKGTEDCRIDNVVFYGGAFHLDFEAAIFQMVTRCTLWNYTTAGMRVQNILEGDQGDSLLAHSVMEAANGTAYGVIYHSGGGLKVLGTKILNGGTGIAIDPASTLTDPNTISDVIIANCSIETFTDAGILLTRTVGGLEPSQIHMVGNQLASNTGVAIWVMAAAGPPAYSSLIANNNIINRVPFAFRLREVNGITIDGNSIRIPGGTIFDVDNTVMNLTIGAGNNYFDYGTPMIGTPGARSYLYGGVFTVAELATLPMSDGSKTFAIDAIGPTDGGYTGYGMAVASPGSGAPAFRVFGGWHV